MALPGPSVNLTWGAVAMIGFGAAGAWWLAMLVSGLDRKMDRVEANQAAVTRLLEDHAARLRALEGHRISMPIPGTPPPGGG